VAALPRCPPPLSSRRPRGRRAVRAVLHILLVRGRPVGVPHLPGGLQPDDLRELQARGRGGRGVREVRVARGMGGRGELPAGRGQARSWRAADGATYAAGGASGRRASSGFWGALQGCDVPRSCARPRITAPPAPPGRAPPPSPPQQPAAPHVGRRDQPLRPGPAAQLRQRLVHQGAAPKGRLQVRSRRAAAGHAAAGRAACARARPPRVGVWGASAAAASRGGGRPGASAARACSARRCLWGQQRPARTTPCAAPPSAPCLPCLTSRPALGLHTVLL
jgi:hypothetical protein